MWWRVYLPGAQNGLPAPLDKKRKEKVDKHVVCVPQSRVQQASSVHDMLASAIR